jgi:hypothetical protein
MPSIMEALRARGVGVGTKLEGNVTAGDMLIGKTGLNADGPVLGTMPNRAGDTAALASAIAGTIFKLRASVGYRDGVDDMVTITDAAFIAANILFGKTLHGLAGTATSDATALAAQIIAGATAYVNGLKVTGTMVSRGSEEFAGWRRAELGIATPPINSRLHLTIPTGAYLTTAVDGKMGIFIDDVDFNSANWLSTINILGLQGTAIAGKRVATGTVTASSATLDFSILTGGTLNRPYVTVSGLSFKPSHVLLMRESAPWIAPELTYSTSYQYGSPSTTFYMTYGNGYRINANGAGAYVNLGGFRMHSEIAGWVHTYIAIE